MSHEARCGSGVKLHQVVRHPERRIVSAKRARVLRKRGESVWYDHTLPSGKARYSWNPNHKASAQCQGCHGYPFADVDIGAEPCRVCQGPNHKADRAGKKGQS